MKQFSSFVHHQPFQLSLLRQELQLVQLYREDGEKDARTERRKQDCDEIQADGDVATAKAHSQEVSREKNFEANRQESRRDHSSLPTRPHNQSRV